MSGERNSSGLASALAELGTMVGQPPAEAEQLEIFEADVPSMTGVLPRPARTGPGRPKGSTNRSQKAWVEYLLQRYRSPLVTLLELATMTPRALAEQFELYEWVVVGNIDGHAQYEKRLATGEAFKRQVEALVATLPYMHQKLPLEIKTDSGEKGGMLIIGELNVTANYNADSAPSFLDDKAPPTLDLKPAATEQKP